MIDDSLSARLIGIFSGVFLNLVLDPPRSRTGFARRTGAAVVFGWVFGDQALSFLEWTPVYNNIVAAFCLTAMFSWSAIGVMRRVIEAYRKDEVKGD